MPIFRKPVNTEDSPTTLPDYFEPVSQSDDSSTSLPDYFEPIKKEDKPSVFSRALSALKPAERIHAGPETKVDMSNVKDATTDEELMAEAEHPTYYDPNKKPEPKSAIDRFIEGVTAVPKSIISGAGAGRFNSGGNLNDSLRVGVSRITAPPEKSKVNAGDEIISEVLSAVGLPGSEAIDAFKNRDYARLAGMGLTAAGITALFHRVGSIGEAPAAEESLIRQPKPTDYVNKSVGQRDFANMSNSYSIPPLKLKDTTPQQDAVAISMTKDMQPRSAANISTETGIPKASVRRTLSELRNKYGLESPRQLPLDRGAEDIAGAEPARFIADAQGSVLDRTQPIPEAPIRPPVIERPTPEEAVQTLQESAVKQPAKSVAWNPFEKSSIIEPEKPLPLRSPNLSAENFPAQVETPKPPVKSMEDKIYDIARNKFNMGRDLPNQKLPDYFEPAKAEAPESFVPDQPTTETTKPIETTPEAPKIEPQKQDLVTRTVAKLQDTRAAALDRIKQRGTFSGTKLSSGLPTDDLADFAVIGATHIAEGAVKFADWSVRMIADLGEEVKPYLAQIFKAAQSNSEEAKLGGAKKLFNSLIEAKGANVEQAEMYAAERPERIKAFSSIKQGGISGAAQSLGQLKGEFEKVAPASLAELGPDEISHLFTAVKTSRLSPYEQARGYSALFKLVNGEEVPQANELQVLDKVFSKYFGQVSGPGASGKFDIGAYEKYGIKPEDFPKSFQEAGEFARKRRNPDDFLTKLANFSSKTTRTVLGTHFPGTAVSFHGFNEAIRNAMFGSNFNPINAAGRFGDALYYLARPGKAQEFLDINANSLTKAVEEGGLRVSTGDIGISPLFKGSNFLTKGFNIITDPKPLFGQVIPALKLKAYIGLLEQYEKAGIEHLKAARAAGEATNNIFGGLNLKALERSPNTQKLFRTFALAPDWMESNIRIGKGMFDAIKHPSSPQNRTYLVGAVNFLGSYIGLNVLNAVNNNGKFCFQNDVGHELDVAIGRDSSGRIRYFRPYGTAIDMIRIPLEIGHAAAEGNMGRAFTDIRSRASEPIQFATDLATNTDYAGRALYDKTTYGKPIPPLEQGENIATDAASHFLPMGAEAGANVLQNKISPEQFAAQVLQVPMGYKMSAQPANKLKFRKMTAR